MTIFLPDEPVALRNAFERALERIFSSKEDVVFYTLSAGLLEALRAHPLVGSYFHDLEIATKMKEHEFRDLAFEVLKEEWLLLWRTHPKNSRIRIELARIKKMIHRPRSVSFNSLFQQMNLAYLEVRRLSPFCRLLEKTSLAFQRVKIISIQPSSLALHRHKKANNAFKPWKSRKRRKRWPDCLSVIRKALQGAPVSLLSGCCPINEYLVSRKRSVLIAKSNIPGNNVFEKRRAMQSLAAVDPFFCLARLTFFLNCWHFNGPFALPAFLKGSWEEIEKPAWDSMWDACEKMVLLGAKMDLNNRLASPSHFLSPFVITECQIIRKDHEGFLDSLKHHLWNHLQQIEQTSSSKKAEKANAVENSHLVLPGTQRDAFVIELALKCWTINPGAKYNEVFDDYLLRCPPKRRLSRSSWERVIRNAKVDRRSKGAKIRGKGKKTLQKCHAI